jgi:hypothetical protein
VESTDNKVIIKVREISKLENKNSIKMRIKDSHKISNKNKNKKAANGDKALEIKSNSI